MNNFGSPSSPGGSGRSKRTNFGKNRKKDPFARPPHPLGFQFLSEERPIRASRFGSVLPTIVAKYGLGRKISVERFHNAWNEALAEVLRAEESMGFYPDDQDEFGGAPSKLETFTKYAKPVSFRGGVLRVEIVSNLLYQELQFYLSAILQGIRKRLPEENVRSIKLIVR